MLAKPIAGKYSLSVVSADRYDPSTGEVLLLGGERKIVENLAGDLAGGTGYVIKPPRRRRPARRAFRAASVVGSRSDPRWPIRARHPPRRGEDRDWQ